MFLNNNTDTILIEIAAYCDPELLNTVNSALIQADYPDRVHFSICYQSDNLDDYNELIKIKNCKVKHLMESEARGSVYARYLCQQMIEDEKYIYQIDSHMRFVKHWDTKIIEQLQSLHDEKGILSVYPPFCTEDMMKLPLDDVIYDNPVNGGVMYTDGFREGDTYFVHCNSIPITNDDYRAYKRNAFIAAGNFFTYSAAHKDVLHDKAMYFYGDELPISIRLFTYGWNVYNPSECYIYHQYERKNRKFPSVTDAMLNENKRLMALLNIEGSHEELGVYGLGNVRTLQEYEQFSGINFKEKKVYLNAETGEFENKDMIGKLSYLQRKKSDNHIFLHQRENIEVVIIDLFNEYKECIKSCLDKFSGENNISFVIATTDKKKPSDDYCDENGIKKVVILRKNETYTQALAKLTKYIGDNCYVALIDSSVRFVVDWDKNYCYGIKSCGDKAALTSWVWLASKETDVDNFFTYNNIIKEFDKFCNYLPCLRFNEAIDLSKRKSPYLTPFISDGFLFCKSDILKNIPVDPELTYEEHQYIYAVRLWTNGINIYYPLSSCLIRTRPENELHNGVNNFNIICGLMGINNFCCKTMPYDYKYKLGTERPLWLWYDFIGVKYDSELMKICDE